MIEEGSEEVLRKSIEEWQSKWKVMMEERQRIARQVALKADKYYDERKFKLAAKYYKLALQHEPAPVFANNLAWSLYACKKNGRAKKYFRKAKKIDSEYKHAYCGIATIYFAEDKYKKAISYFHKAIKLDATFTSAYLGLADVYSQTDEHEKGIELYQKIIKMGESKLNKWNYFSFAYSLGELKRYQEAIEQLEIALNKYPEKNDVYNRLGVLYKKQGKYEESLKYFELEISINPKHESAHCNIAHVLTIQRNYQKAEEFISRAFTTQKTQNGHFYHGIFLYKMGRYPEALDLFYNCNKRFPNYEHHHKVNYYIAMSQLKMKENENVNELIELFNIVLSECKVWSKGYYRRGILYLQHSPPLEDLALEDFKQAKINNPLLHYIDRLSEKKISAIDSLINNQTKQ